MSARQITVEHDGRTLYGHVMTIESTSLGLEDHGIVTAYLHCKNDGGGIGVGGYCLDRPVRDAGGKFVRREGTAYGLDHLMAMARTAGVQRWEQLPGTSIIVLFEGKSWLGRTAVGFAHLTDEKRILIFKEHAEAWKGRESDGAVA